MSGNWYSLKKHFVLLECYTHWKLKLIYNGQAISKQGMHCRQYLWVKMSRLPHKWRLSWSIIPGMPKMGIICSLQMIIYEFHLSYTLMKIVKCMWCDCGWIYCWFSYQGSIACMCFILVVCVSGAIDKAPHHSMLILDQLVQAQTGTPSQYADTESASPSTDWRPITVCWYWVN